MSTYEDVRRMHEQWSTVEHQDAQRAAYADAVDRWSRDPHMTRLREAWEHQSRIRIGPGSWYRLGPDFSRRSRARRERLALDRINQPRPLAINGHAYRCRTKRRRP